MEIFLGVAIFRRCDFNGSVGMREQTIRHMYTRMSKLTIIDDERTW